MMMGVAGACVLSEQKVEIFCKVFLIEEIEKQFKIELRSWIFEIFGFGLPITCLDGQFSPGFGAGLLQLGPD